MRKCPCTITIPNNQSSPRNNGMPKYWTFVLCKDAKTSIDRYFIPMRFIDLLSTGFRNINTIWRSRGRTLFEGLIYPSVLRKGLFTKAAVDNSDHNPSSTTSKSSLYGTGISIFQHPSGNDSGIERNRLTLGNATT